MGYGTTAVKTAGLPVALNVSPAAVGTAYVTVAAGAPGIVKAVLTGYSVVPIVTDPEMATGVPAPGVTPETEYVAVSVAPCAGALGETARLTVTGDAAASAASSRMFG
jgi:hypothetical protein